MLKLWYNRIPYGDTSRFTYFHAEKVSVYFAALPLAADWAERPWQRAAGEEQKLARNGEILSARRRLSEAALSREGDVGL